MAVTIPNIVPFFMKLRYVFRRKSKGQKVKPKGQRATCSGTKQDPSESSKLYRVPSPYPHPSGDRLHSLKKQSPETSRPTSSSSNLGGVKKPSTSKNKSKFSLSIEETLCDTDGEAKSKDKKKQKPDGKGDGIEWEFVPKFQLEALNNEIQGLKKDVERKDTEIERLRGMLDNLESGGI